MKILDSEIISGIDPLQSACILYKIHVNYLGYFLKWNKKGFGFLVSTT